MPAYDFTTFGALIGLVIAIILIIKKVHPAYSLILGALIGGSGILAGALIKTGSAQKIAETIVEKMGEKKAVAAIAIATMIICAVGVFVDISVITVAPIALAIGKRANLSKESLLLAMIGGGKAGNIISPNPNTIAASEAFGVDLTALMMKNAVPAVCALIVTIILSSFLSRKKNGLKVLDTDCDTSDSTLPGFLPSILGPIAVIILLALRPIAGISIDPLIALPIGGILCTIVTGNSRKLIEYTEFGLSKVIGVSILLIGTGTIAGIIKASALQYDVIHVLEMMNMPAFVLAPLAGILMAGATASTTAGATIASQTFASTLIEQQVPALAAAAMIHAGATVIDSLPHGSFFHATGGSVNMSIGDRMKLIPFEAMVGLTSTITSVILFLLFQ